MGIIQSIATEFSVDAKCQASLLDEEMIYFLPQAIQRKKKAMQTTNCIPNEMQYSKSGTS